MTLTTQWLGDVPVLQTSNPANVHIILVAPLFEEANRMRRFLADLMRGIETKGFAASLPDLPGMGEYPPIEKGATEKAIHTALSDVACRLREAGSKIVVASFRGGSLFDHVVNAQCYWRFSPETGARLLKTTERTEGGIDIAKNNFHASFLKTLRTMEPRPLAPLRTARLSTERGEADTHLHGPALWRWAEPGQAPELASQCVENLADWIAQCAVS